MNREAASRDGTRTTSLRPSWEAGRRQRTRASMSWRWPGVTSSS